MGKTILNEYVDITSQVILVKKSMHLELIPFSLWRIAPNHKSPDWWVSYNDVKHQRLHNFYKANLGDVINSLVGLYLLEMYYIRDITKNGEEGVDRPDSSSKLFEIKEWDAKYSVFSGESNLFAQFEEWPDSED